MDYLKKALEIEPLWLFPSFLEESKRRSALADFAKDLTQAAKHDLNARQAAELLTKWAPDPHTTDWVVDKFCEAYTYEEGVTFFAGYRCSTPPETRPETLCFPFAAFYWFWRAGGLPGLWPAAFSPLNYERPLPWEPKMMNAPEWVWKEIVYSDEPKTPNDAMDENPEGKATKGNDERDENKKDGATEKIIDELRKALGSVETMRCVAALLDEESPSQNQRFQALVYFLVDCKRAGLGLGDHQSEKAKEIAERVLRINGVGGRQSKAGSIKGNAKDVERLTSFLMEPVVSAPNSK